MNDNDTLLLCVIIVLVAVIFGGHIGIAVSGGIDKPEIAASQPNIFNVFGWIWQGIKFYFQIMAFQVPGCPAWLSAIYLLIPIVTGFIILKFVRGTNT